MTENSIMMIKPYKDQGQWMFDDPTVGLQRELLIAGADTMLDILSEGKDSLTIVFSKTKFPGSEMELELMSTVDEGEGGTVYRWEEKKHNVWLCPALLLYFKEPPKNIFIKVK